MFGALTAADFGSTRDLPAGRKAIALIELIISMTTASILVAGITAAILIANQATAVATARQANTSLNTASLDRLRTDLAEAIDIQARTATTATLTVNDRDLDGLNETIQYRWQGAGNALEIKENTADWRSLSDPLTAFGLAWETSEPQSIEPTPSPLDPVNSFVFQSRTIANMAANTFSLDVNIPTTYRTGDLLVAAVSVQGDQKDTLAAPAGWVKILETHRKADVTLALYYTFAAPGTSTTFAWTEKDGACYGTIAHFLVGSTTPTLTGFATGDGDAQLVTTPASVAVANNSLVLRVMAGKIGAVVEGETNMPGHISIVMRRDASDDPAVGMAYRSYNTGVVPEESFSLPAKTKFAAATVVFSP